MARIKTILLAVALAAAGAVAPPSLRGVKEAASGETADTFEASLAKEVERLNAALAEKDAALANKDAVIAEKDAVIAELSQHRSSGGRTLDFGSSSTSGDGDGLFVPTVCVITDELYNPTSRVSGINPFWEKWRAGADAAVAQVKYKNFGQPDSIDVGGYIEAIAACCDEADALVVAVPFSQGTPSYDQADAAINDCLAKNGEFPIFSTRYDTYKNPQLYGYVGGENYAYGQQCARALLFTENPANATDEPQANLEAVSGRGPALSAPVAGAHERCPNATCQVVWSELTRSNAGQQRLVAGLNKTLLDYGFSLEIIAPSAEDQLEAYDATTGILNKTFINSGNFWPEYADISSGFQVVLSTRGYEWFATSSKLLCGQVLWGDPSWQVGEDPFRQGQTAVSSAAAAARLLESGGEWQATKGNNEANSGSSTIQSLKSDKCRWVEQTDGSVLADESHTTIMEIDWTGASYTGVRQWLFTRGHVGLGAEHWLWNGGTNIQFGMWNGAQINSLDIQSCQSLATTYDASSGQYVLYCNVLPVAAITLTRARELTCPAGMYDKTGGSSMHWGCGYGCAGGPYTDGSCGCACQCLSGLPSNLRNSGGPCRPKGFCHWKGQCKPNFFLATGAENSYPSCSLGEWAHRKQLYNPPGGYQQLMCSSFLPEHWVECCTNGVTGMAHIGLDTVGESDFRGCIKEVKIFDKALTKDEILDVLYPPLDDTTIRDAVKEWMYGYSQAAVEARYGPISKWNTRYVTDMSYLFCGDYQFGNPGNTAPPGCELNNRNFNEDISGWDTSGVKTMHKMFFVAEAFDKNIGGWDTSNVEDMSYMFADAFAFNQDIGGWAVHSVKYMQYMFNGALAFDKDISGWTVASVKDMSGMFKWVSTFNQDLGWCLAYDVATDGIFGFGCGVYKCPKCNPTSCGITRKNEFDECEAIDPASPAGSDYGLWVQ